MPTRRPPRFKKTGISVTDDVSVRKCLISGDLLPRERMIRFVLGPENLLTPDIEAKLPGKGFWLNARRDIVETALLSKRWFTKAARHDVVIPEDLLTILDNLLGQRCKNLLGIAKKSGKVVAGFEKVEAALGKGKVQTLLFAADGADGSLAKLKNLPEGMKIMRDLTAEEQGEALGRSNCVFVGLYSGKLTDTLEAELQRLRLFRKGSIEPRM
ncbi:MAG: DUF448 domain-containing protein [Alphaproteobacteria bacterium]|nr:DUF448 domain-containing protein [Alphaproteobacteria bacterium]